MTHIIKTTSLALVLGVTFSACVTVQPPAPPVIITPPPVVETCIRINTLKRVEIPAVTKSGFSVVSIETEDEQYYDPETKKWVMITIPPIERREPWTKIITPAQTIYVDSNNREVTDICELNTGNNIAG